MGEAMLAARGIMVTEETVRQWALKFSQSFANQIRRRASTIMSGRRPSPSAAAFAPERPVTAS
jgi:transposase-like protein